MTWTSRTVFAVLLLCTGGAVRAGEFSYICEVSHVYTLAGNESLERLPALEKVMKENSFSVSRETGALAGKSLTLDTSRAKSTRVLTKGSMKNSFSAIADFGPFENGTHPYHYIKIEEFSRGAAKPFVVMGEVGIVTGVCE